MNTNDMTQHVFQFQKVMGVDSFAMHHSVSTPLLNKSVFLPGRHSLDSPISLQLEFKKTYNFRGSPQNLNNKGNMTAVL